MDNPLIISIHTQKCIQLAEKLLAAKQVDACMDLCYDIERLIYVYRNQGKPIIKENLYLEKIRNLHIRLNAIMAEKLRQINLQKL